MKILMKIVAAAMAGLWILSCLLFSSCDGEVVSNGDLDGFWHLRQVDTLATGGSYFMERQTVFWSVQAELLETRILPYDRVLYRFEHDADYLRIYEPMGSRDYTDANADFPITEVSKLFGFGVHALDTRFRIVRLGSGDMVLEDEILRLYFEKY